MPSSQGSSQSSSSSLSSLSSGYTLQDGPPTQTPTSTPFPSPSSTPSDARDYGWRWCKWTGYGARSGHYAAHLLSDPAKSGQVSVRWLDMSGIARVPKSQLGLPLTTKEIVHITRAPKDQSPNPFFNMRMEDLSESSFGTLPDPPRTFPPPPVRTSNWHSALAFYLREDSPFNVDLLRTSSLGVPCSIPHQVWPSFIECAVSVLTFIDTAPSDSLTTLERWRLRVLFYSLPRLLLRGHEKFSHHGKLRQMTQRCAQFMAGEWPALWSSFVADRSVPQGRAQYRSDVYSLENQAEELARAGNLGKALRTLTSPGLTDRSTDEVMESLQKLHPQNVLPPSIPSTLRVPPDTQSLLETFGFHPDKGFSTKPLIDALIASSPRTAADQWCWRSRELLLPMVRRSADFAQLYLKVIVLPLAQGGVPDPYHPMLSGGVLFALAKPAPKTGVRPVGNGDLTRKATARMLLKPHKAALASFFLDTHTNYKQFAVGVRSGTEKMFVAISSLLGDCPPPGYQPTPQELSDEVMAVLQLDFINAYNEVIRQALFDALQCSSSQTWPGTSFRKGSPLTQHPLQNLVALLADLYDVAASLHYHGKDGAARELLSKTGFHQGDVLGSLAYALATFDFFADVLKSDPAVAGFSYVDNSSLVGPLRRIWAMYDRIRVVAHGLNLRLNPLECLLWVPAWSYLPAPPPVLHEVASAFPLAKLQYCPKGFKLLGLPLGTPQFASDMLRDIQAAIFSNLEPIQRLRDGRLYLQMLRSCFNVKPHFYLRNLPPSLSWPLAVNFDSAVEQSLSTYLCFPSGWRDPSSHGGVYVRAMAQARNPLRVGGLGLTPACSIVHSSFFAGFSASFSWLARSSFRTFLSHDPLGVFSGSQSHFLLKGFAQCRDELAKYGCYVSEDDPSLVPERAVVLPSLQQLFPPENAMLDGLNIPPQRVLSQTIRENCPLWRYSNATAGGSEYDLARISHLSRSKCKVAGDTRSVLAQGTKGDKSELSQSPLSWLLAVAGSKVHDIFPHRLFVIYISLVLGVPVPRFPHEENRCTCGAPFDPFGHHRMTCKTWQTNAAIRGHDSINRSLIDAVLSVGMGCTMDARMIPSHLRSRKKADVLFDLTLRSGWKVIGDLTVCHPVSGALDSLRSPLGTWLSNVMEARFNAKKNKHTGPYSAMQLHFVPLVVSTFGVLHEDFLRLLWLVTSASRGSGLAVGEIRESGPSAGERQMLFAKLRARVSVAAARAAACRFLGYSNDVNISPSAASHVPSDPAFLEHGGVTTDTIGPVREQGG